MEDGKTSDCSKAPLQTVFINGNKISTLIPNRIFVGGFPMNTTEAELREFFCKFGEVRDVKIIPDKAGQSKGSYGFVTFESQDIAEKIIAEQAESLLFKDRKLNIGRAVKKQPLTPKSELQSAVFFNPLSMGYGSLYPYQDYSYLFNQDLSTMYQNYSNMIPQLSLLPSLLSPMMTGGSEALGLSLNPYQQLQSLLPFTLAQQYSGFSPCVTPLSIPDNALTSVNDSFAISTIQSPTNTTIASNDISSSEQHEVLKTTDSVTISSPYLSYGTDYQSKVESKIVSKVPFTTITNQCKDASTNGDIVSLCDDESEQPRKRIKYEETVSRSCDAVHYVLPNN